MKGSSLNVEKILYDSAEDIDIDMQFKNDLKNRIMAREVIKEKQVLELNHRKMPYMKVAGWVIFAALSGSAIWGAGGVYSHMVAVNSPSQKVTDVQNKETGKNLASGTNGGSTANTVDSKEQLASADIKKGADENQGIKPNVPVQPSKSSGTENVSKGNTGSQNQTASGTANGVTQGTASDTASKPSDTPADAPAVTEPVKTVNLTMVAGRYIIKNIEVSKSESVSTLPEELKSLTADECAKLPAVGSGQLTYEKEDGNVYMLSHVNNREVPIDKGKTPVLYAPIGLVSYIKEETPTSEASGSTSSTGSSEVWIFDSNSGNKYNVLSSKDGKCSYINSFWSGDGKTLYVLQKDNSTGKFDLTKLTLDIK